MFKPCPLCMQVFITCSTILCKAGVSDSRCSKGCDSRPKREAPALADNDDFVPTEEHKMEDSHLPFGGAIFLSGAQRHKRDVAFQTSNRLVSQGPVRLRAVRSVTNQGKVVRDNFTPDSKGLQSCNQRSWAQLDSWMQLVQNLLCKS